MDDAQGLSGTETSDFAAVPAGAPVLAVSVVGGATFTYQGREVALRNRKARAMLGYLALSETSGEQRERVAGLFWSESSEQNARTTLRQVVHEVRSAMEAVGCKPLLSTRTAVGLQPGTFDVDLNHILAAVASREAPEALLRQKRLAETLLAGFDDLDPLFHIWLTARRQSLHDRLLRGLEDGYHDIALPRRRRRRLAEAALLLDPTHEEACRVAMRCAAEDGEIGAALRAYDELYQVLGDEYDMEPSVPTQTLVAEVKQGRFDATAAATGPARAEPALVPPAPVQTAAAPGTLTVQHPKPAVFITPFVLNGVDSDRVHLVEGFRLELIACLVRFREWYVGSRSEIEDDHPGAPVAERYLVSTTAYQAGATINAVMVLQERASGLAIWSERFEVRLDHWFVTQQLLVRRIAAALNVQLSNERLARIAGIPDVSLEAYDLWLRAQVMVLRFSPDNWNRATQMLTEGIERAPGFSPLYSSLVQINNTLEFVHAGVFRDRAKQERTLALAQQAVALDPRDSRAELCLGWSLAFSKRYSLAQIHMEISRELNPYDSWTLIATGLFHACCGNVAQAQARSAQAMEMTLSPNRSIWTYHAMICYLSGDDEETLAASDHAQGLTPTLLAWRAAALWNLRRKDEARAEAASFLAAIRQHWFGQQPPTDAMIGRWLLHLYPIGHAPSWERLRAGITGAGIPSDGMTFGER